jgi:hypothetical protein
VAEKKKKAKKKKKEKKEPKEAPPQAQDLPVPNFAPQQAQGGRQLPLLAGLPMPLPMGGPASPSQVHSADDALALLRRQHEGRGSHPAPRPPPAEDSDDDDDDICFVPS